MLCGLDRFEYPLHCEHFVIQGTPANFSGLAPRYAPLSLTAPFAGRLANVSGGTLRPRQRLNYTRAEIGFAKLAGNMKA